MSEREKIMSLFRHFSDGSIDEALIFRTLESLGAPPPENFSRDKRRWQDRIILAELPERCSVLDLGCGDGELLSTLIKVLKVRGQGVELDPQAVLNTIERGVPVINVDLDEGLSDFADLSFDYVILESTLQALKNPIKVLKEMLRVGRRVIISFPNFGHWRVRLDLAVRGRMPVTPDLPHNWYDTPNIHLLTLADFFDWTRRAEVKIDPGYCLCQGQVRPLAEADNLMAEEVLAFLETERLSG